MSETTLPEALASTASVAAPSLLDEIMAQTRFKPESESYDIARQGVTAFTAPATLSRQPSLSVATTVVYGHRPCRER